MSSEKTQTASAREAALRATLATSAATATTSIATNLEVACLVAVDRRVASLAANLETKRASDTPEQSMQELHLLRGELAAGGLTLDMAALVGHQREVEALLRAKTAEQKVAVSGAVVDDEELERRDTERRAAEDAARRRQFLDRYEPQLAAQPYLGGFVAPDDGDLGVWLTLQSAANVDARLYPACWRWYHAFERSAYLAQKRSGRSGACRGTVAVSVGFTKIPELARSDRFGTRSALDVAEKLAASPTETMAATVIVPTLPDAKVDKVATENDGSSEAKTRVTAFGAADRERYTWEDWTVPEKVDGTNFLFKVDGPIGARHTVRYWCQIDALDREKIANNVTYKYGVERVESVRNLLNRNYRYHTELIGRARQNRITYDENPAGPVVFHIQDERTGLFLSHDELVRECARVGLTAVALLARYDPRHPERDPADVCRRIVATHPHSFLGGDARIEGAVVHVYACRDNKARSRVGYGDFRAMVKRKLVTREFKEQRHVTVAKVSVGHRAASLGARTRELKNGDGDDARHVEWVKLGYDASGATVVATKFRETKRGDANTSTETKAAAAAGEADLRESAAAIRLDPIVASTSRPPATLPPSSAVPHSEQHLVSASPIVAAQRAKTTNALAEFLASDDVVVAHTSPFPSSSSSPPPPGAVSPSAAEMRVSHRSSPTAVADCVRAIGESYAVPARWAKAVERLRNRGVTVDYAVRVSWRDVVGTDDPVPDAEVGIDAQGDARLGARVVCAFAPLDNLLGFGDALATDLDTDLRAERRADITARLYADCHAKGGVPPGPMAEAGSEAADEYAQVLFELLFAGVAECARHGFDEWREATVAAERRRVCTEWYAECPTLVRNSEFRRQLDLAAIADT